MKSSELIFQKPIEFYEVGNTLSQVIGFPGLARNYSHIIRCLTDFEINAFIYELYNSFRRKQSLTLLIDFESGIETKSLESIGINLIYSSIDINFNNVDPENLLKFSFENSKNIFEDINSIIKKFIESQTFPEDFETDYCPFDINFVLLSRGLLDEYRQYTVTNHSSLFNVIKNLDSKVFASRNEQEEFNITLTILDISTYSKNRDFSNFINLLERSFGTLIVAEERNKTDKLFIYNTKNRIEIGNISNLTVLKNNLGGGYNQILFSGEAISTPHGFIENSKPALADYKVQYFKYFSYRFKLPYFEIGING